MGSGIPGTVEARQATGWWPSIYAAPYVAFSPVWKGSIGHRSSGMSYEGFHNWGWGKGLRILIIVALLADTVKWLLECVDCCLRQLLFKEWYIEQSVTLKTRNEKNRSEKNSREAFSREHLRAGQPEAKENLWWEGKQLKKDNNENSATVSRAGRWEESEARPLTARVSPLRTENLSKVEDRPWEP